LNRDLRGGPHAAGFHLRRHYWGDRAAREELVRFLHRIHGIDLGPWWRAGWWDEEDYTHYSLFDGPRMVSTVGLFSLDMVVAGEAMRLGQISGVGTLPAHRRRGLARWLLDRVLADEDAGHEGWFLFADHRARALYASCGFAPVVEEAVLLRRTAPRPRGGLRRLDLEDPSDRELLARLAHERRPVSARLGVHGPRLLLFHALTSLAGAGWYLADLDLVVFRRLEGRRLILFDLVGRTLPPFDELHPWLVDQPHDEILFRFEPDLLVVEADERCALPDHNTHVRGALAWPPGVIPWTAHA
jgi:GNAT superfamily N-acetyltransferase